MSMIMSDDTSENSRPSIVAAFIDMMQQFLTALSEVFPECTKVARYKVALEVSLATGGDSVRTEAIEAYHTSMSPYYSRCLARDDTLLQENIELMRNIDMPRKWTPELHPDTKEAIWEYIKKLNEFANIYSMYSRIPTGMLTSIETLAQTLAAQIGDGSMSLRDLNMQTMSSQIMSALNPADIQEFAHRMQSGDLTSMMENVSTMYSMIMEARK